MQSVCPPSEFGSDFEINDQPKLMSQADVNDLVRDLELTEDKAQIFSSRLKEHNLVKKGVSSSYYLDRHVQYSKFFVVEENVCFYQDVPGLYDATEWRLFIDSSKESLKAVLLLIGNMKPSIPFAHAVELKKRMARWHHC